MALEKSLDPDTVDMLHKSHSASKSLVYVIDDLLSLSTAQENHFSLLESAFDIKASILEALEPLAAHARSKGLKFEFIDHNDLPRSVKGDVHRFQQIIVQVVSNAVHFTKAGNVTVEARVVSSSVSFCFLEISVRDTGEGLTERQLGMLTQRAHSNNTG
jgi:signal transduction histidine kinase